MGVKNVSEAQMMKELIDVCRRIRPADRQAMDAARARERSLAKVPGSLGRLEDMAVKIAGITGKVMNNSLTSQAVLIMSADHGVTAEGVASAPQTVTTSQTINFTRGITGIGALAKYFHIPLLVTDLGMRYPAPQEYYTDSMLDENGRLTDKIVDRRIASGTENLLIKPAMTREQTLHAIQTGFQAVDAAKTSGVRLLGLGEMGIGNTTPSSALLCVLSGLSPETVVGRGGGLDDEGLQKKILVVKEAIARYRREAVHSWSETRSEEERVEMVIELIEQLGGLEIAAMTGAYLRAAQTRLPVVIDGLISAVSALLAYQMRNEAADMFFASHCSTEPGYLATIEAMGLKSVMDLQMRLGEGSGCPLMFKVLEAACATMDLMGTLEEGAVDAAYLERFSSRDYTGGASTADNQSEDAAEDENGGVLCTY